MLDLLTDAGSFRTCIKDIEMKDLDWFRALRAIVGRKGRVGECVTLSTQAIAKKMNCHAATARRHLAALEKAHIVKSEEVQAKGCIKQKVWTWRISPAKHDIEQLNQNEMDMQ